MVKHVSSEELQAIPHAAEDLFIIGGKDALEKRQQVGCCMYYYFSVILRFHICVSCVSLFLFVLQADAAAAAKAAAVHANSATAEEEEDFLVVDDIEVTVSAPAAAKSTQLDSAHSSSGTLSGGLKRDLAEVHLLDDDEAVSKKARDV